jgi:retron-type reverse transcriptase
VSIPPKSHRLLGYGVIGPEVREKRPIGIPAFEDKILQRAVQLAADRRSDGTDIRGGVCGLKSDGFSYGFRPGKSARQALNRIWKACMNISGGYIIDMGISKYANLWFDDTIPHEKLREILGQRVSDGVIQRIIGKWLNAGVMEEGTVQPLLNQTKGLPMQSSSVSGKRTPAG